MAACGEYARAGKRGQRRGPAPVPRGRSPGPVIQRPKRTALARGTSVAGRRISPRMPLSPGAAAVTATEASAAVGPSPGRADTRATLSHKQRGRGGTLQSFGVAGQARCSGRRPPSPALPPQTARGKGASRVRRASRSALEFSSPPWGLWARGRERGAAAACARSVEALAVPAWPVHWNPGQGGAEPSAGAGDGGRLPTNRVRLPRT
jgi:hypothetical protein